MIANYQGRNQLIFSWGQSDSNLLLYLKTNHDFEIFGAGIARFPAWLQAC